MPDGSIVTIIVTNLLNERYLYRFQHAVAGQTLAEPYVAESTLRAAAHRTRLLWTWCSDIVVTAVVWTTASGVPANTGRPVGYRLKTTGGGDFGTVPRTTDASLAYQQAALRSRSSVFPVTRRATVFTPPRAATTHTARVMTAPAYRHLAGCESWTGYSTFRIPARLFPVVISVRPLLWAFNPWPVLCLTFSLTQLKRALQHEPHCRTAVWITCCNGSLPVLT